MRNPFLFFSDLVRQPVWVSVWVAILALANIASLLFWPELVAMVIFTIFIVSALTIMALYSYFGFEKILGIGHVYWIYLLPYILLQLAYTDGLFLLYLVMLSVLLFVSLVLDVIDVWTYIRNVYA